MPEYIYLIHPFNHEYFENPSPLEIAMMDAHYDYLQQGVADGVVILAGPCLDDTFEVVILRTEHEQSAKEFMLNDPSVKSNLMMAELHPMRISLMREF